MQSLQSNCGSNCLFNISASINILINGRTINMNEFFPKHIKLGSLEVFREELEFCFSGCVRDCLLLFKEPLDPACVSVFLSLLLNKVFGISRFSLATLLNKENVNKETKKTGIGIKQLIETKKELNSSYPILKQKIQTATQNWRNNTTNIISRWNNDKAEITQVIFNSGSIGNFVALGSQQGDEHENGQQSLIIELSCGRKLAYKPRCLDIEQNFYAFAQQLGFSELYQPRYLSKKNYGWMEYIPHKQCKSIEQVADYYYQAGLLLSLLYTLEAVDIHHGNIIARGCQPVIIDLETLFHHREDSINNKNDDLASLNLGNHTVLKTHFIPQYLTLETEKELAAIFPVFEKETPAKITVPQLNNKPIAVNDYTEQFLNGFRAGYSRIVENKNILLSTDGPLSLFVDCSARYVCRPTKTYNRLILASSHPKYLQSEPDQNLLFEKLNIDVEDRQFMASLVNSEKDCLFKAEVPRFTHKVDKKAISLNGKVITDKFFSLSGVELSQRKISGMNAKDLAGQIQLIKHSFELANPQPTRHCPNIIIKPEMSFAKLCETAAFSIGQFLQLEAMHHQDGKIWPMFTHDTQGRVCLDPTNRSLYGGNLGIYLFCAHLQNRFSEFTNRAALINTTKEQLAHTINSHHLQNECGGFEGLASSLYVISHLIKLWPEQQWLEHYGQQLLGLLTPMVNPAPKLDIISGSAGAILSLISYYQQTRNKLSLDIANSFGNHLVSTFHSDGQIGWPIENGNVLSGFAHGNAGIGYALMCLADVADNEFFTRCALMALEYESNQYLHEIANWPDKRFETEFEQKEDAMTAWCHGAVGIGMSRLGLKYKTKKQLPDFFDLDIERALSHLSNQPIIKSENLCHGNFGNFELLIMANEQGLLNAQQSRETFQTIAERIEFISQNSLEHSAPSYPVSCSLMTGWAGIGYQLLRFANPVKIPSVLLLDCFRE